MLDQLRIRLRYWVPVQRPRYERMIEFKPARKLPQAPLGMLVGEFPQPQEGGVIDLSSGHDRILRRVENSFICDIFVLYATEIVVEWNDGAASRADLYWRGPMSWKKSAMVAVKVEVGPSIMLHSGAWFDFASPHNSEFTAEDIAHGLAHICRYSGQCSRFYSVAEHSLLVSDVAEGFEFEALLHDAAEAFIGDITRPLKQMLPDFKRIEAAVQDAVLRRFGIASPLPPEIKEADLRVLAAEQRQIMPPGTDGWLAGLTIEPAPIVVRHLPPDTAKHMWLDRFETLRRGRIVKGQS